MGAIQAGTIVTVGVEERLEYSWGEWNAEVMTQGVQWEAEEVSSVRCSQGDKITASVSTRRGKVSIESSPNLELEK